MLKFIVAASDRGYMELRDNEKGQAYVEYGILLALVAVGLIITLVAFKDQIAAAFTSLGNKVDGTP